MKKQTLALMFAGAYICLASHLAEAQNIMPFGDSVTSFGSAPESSYRYWLWQDLQNAGFTGVAFVGSSYGCEDGAPANSDFDQSYEGGAGWTTQTGVSDAGAPFEGANIVLLDLGSNDYDPSIGVNASLGNVRTNLEQIIENFRAVNSDVVILLAEPTPWVTTDPQERRFMSKLKGAVARAGSEERHNGANVITVNLWGGFNARRDTKDGAHPNVQGEQKIAKKYFQALKRVL